MRIIAAVGAFFVRALDDVAHHQKRKSPGKLANALNGDADRFDVDKVGFQSIVNGQSHEVFSEGVCGRCASSHCLSASRAAERKKKGPSRGPETGSRSAHHW